MASKKLMQILNDFKIGLFIIVEGHELAEHKRIDHEAFLKAEAYEKKYLADNPHWKSMQKKFHEADKGDYVKEIKNSPEEEKFKKSALYRGYEKIYNDADIAAKKSDKETVVRLREGRGTEQEKKIFKSAEMTIWESGNKYFGKERKYQDTGEKMPDLPVLTFDAAYYEIAKGYVGFGQKSVEKFRNRLNLAGYNYERHDDSTWTIYRDTSLVKKREKHVSGKKSKKSKSR